MPTCPRCALLALAVALLAFAGCDTNNPGSSLEEVQGTYSVLTLSFDPTDPAVLDDVDVLADLEPGTRIEIFGDGNALVRFEPVGGFSQLATGTARATSRTVTVTARTDGDADKLQQVLLPPSFSLNRDEADANRLSADVLLSNVNLEAYNPADFGGLDNVRGRMTITLDRVTN
jgi:hypothetical protein